MNVTASVVIPTYNRSHQLLLTLTSFENQEYPKDGFEVIVVDDGSDDQTKRVLENYKAPYKLTYTSSGRNRGRSAARNIGVKLAKGSIIIFCDADFLVRPNFISTHVQYHSAYDRAVVSGVPNSWIGAFTHYYPEFSDAQKNDLRHTLERAHLWNDKILESGQVVEVITQEDVRNNIDKLDQVVAWYMTQEVKDECKRTDVAPWLVFITRCVSLRFEDFHRAGGFNEEFKNYGLEDWELGYRLSKDGVTFVCMDELVGYHQEHPISYRGMDGNLTNLKKIFKRHGITDPEIAFMSISPPWSDFYGYKNNLRKLKELLSLSGETNITVSNIAPNPIRITGGETNITTHQEFNISSPNRDINKLVPIFYWSELPTFRSDEFKKSVVLSRNGLPDCMWIGPKPYGGFGESNGLIFFRTTFSLQTPSIVHIEVPYADDLALVYVDGGLEAVSSVNENMTICDERI